MADAPGPRGEQPSRSLLARIFWREAVEFECRLPVTEAVAALAAATRRRSWKPSFRDGVSGRVDAERVVLRRFRIFDGPCFRPRFEGSFVRRGDTTVLAGRFGLTLVGKASMIFSIAALLFATQFMIIVALAQPSVFRLLVGVVGAFQTWVTGVGLCRKEFGGDRDYIAQAIRRALGDPA